MTGRREVYQAAMREAHALAWDLKWSAASQKYREALAEFPDDATARVSLAVALTRTGQAEEALKEYLVVRQALPKDALVLARIAELHIRLGQREAGVRAYQELAELYLAQGERAKALEAWQHALEQAAGQRRALLELREAVARAGASELLREVEASLALAGPEEPAAPEPARPASQEAPALASTHSATLVADSDQVPLVTWLRYAEASDPAQVLALAEEEARGGRAASAVAGYLRAAELLSDADAVSSARAAAANLAADWLPGDVEEVAALPPVEREVVLDALAESRRWLEAARPSAALDEALRAIGSGPAYLPTQIRLAEVDRETGKLDLARERILAVADLYEMRGEHRRAARVLRRQVALEPEQVALWQRLVQCFRTAGDAEEAADALFEWADRLLAEGEVAAALEKQREALRTAPRADRFLEHGLLLESLGQVEPALAAFAEARALAPAEEAIAAAQSRCEALLGQWPEMEANLEVVIATVPGEPIVAARILDQYRAALARVGESGALRYCLARVLQAVGQVEEATEHLARVARDDTRPGRLANYHLAEACLASGDTAAAIDHLWRVGDPASAETAADRALAVAGYQRLADACRQVGDWSGTARALAGLVDVDPDAEALYPRLAEAYFQCGRLAEASATLDHLASLYAARQDYAQAQAIYHGLIQLAPDGAAAREKLGRLYLEMGQREEGLAELEQAAALRAARGEVESAAADLKSVLDACRQQDPPRALAVRERLAALTPGDVDLRRELVAAHLKAGRSVRALAEARAMVDYLLAEDRLEEAAAAARLVMQIDPWDADARLRLSGILARLGQKDEAVEMLRRVLARDPSNEAARQELARLSDQGNQGKGSGGAGGSAS